MMMMMMTTKMMMTMMMAFDVHYIVGVANTDYYIQRRTNSDNCFLQNDDADADSDYWDVIIIYAFLEEDSAAAAAAAAGPGMILASVEFVVHAWYYSLTT